MANFEYGADYGKGGTDMFQLSNLELDGEDVVSRVDQGVHLRDEEHLIEYLAGIFGMPASEISVEAI